MRIFSTSFSFIQHLHIKRFTATLCTLIKVILIFLISVLSISIQAQAPDWLWAKSYPSLGTNYFVSMTINPGNGDVYTSGNFLGEMDVDPGPDTFMLNSGGSWSNFISKLDASGTFIWG